MRRDGDRLVEFLSRAATDVLICAPFIKEQVLRRLLAIIPATVGVRVVTRWLPLEVAVGVSDLAVFDVVAGRDGAHLQLLDRLHAKLYVAGGAALVGSANLTGAALGWSEKPNLELLVQLASSDRAVRDCIEQLGEARDATTAERDRVRALAAEATTSHIRLAADVSPDDPAVMWLPRLAAPGRLYQVYVPQTRGRVTTSVLEDATDDLEALAISPGLSEGAFNAAVAHAFARMPAVRRLLDAAADDLTDADGADLISAMPVDRSLEPGQRWLIVREWMTSFLGDRYEIAPASFVTRLKPGAGQA